MNGKGLMATLDSLLRWITRLVAVNVLWILFSLAGLLAGGIFPATAAALGIVRKWLMGDLELKIWKTFKLIYKQEFVSSNIIGWLIALAGAVLYVNYQLIAGSAGEISVFIPFAFYLVVFFYSLVLMWSFPLLVHYRATWFQHIRNALIIGLTKIHYTIGMGMVLFSIAFLSLEFPGVIPFFSISIAALCCMWFALQVFGKLDEKPS